ncbi:putative pentatricopeptide repeat-containing protein At5g47460 [Primulina eburnea]|uniref:putative pentatricopeptide repeat-containing protein At5g47460 n=1 Tax=Primulina eburnea TaxID=1245227 RepID=UPI003C6C68A4
MLEFLFSNYTSFIRGSKAHSFISRTFPAVLERQSTTWIGPISYMDSGALISDMAVTNTFKPNISSIIYSIRACTYTGLFSHGQQLHCHILKSGFDSDVYVSTDLINFYVKFNRVNDAQNLFVEIPDPTVVSWNSLISGYVNHGQFRKALKVFIQLESSNVFADSYSFTAALSACGQLRLVQVGRSVHSKIVKYGVGCSVFVANCLTDMYGKCGFTMEATAVFQEMVEKDNISWNSVIAANARNGKLEQAYTFMLEMPEPDTISYNELIDGIARYGVIEDAITVLSKMQNSNSSSWNSIITGYVNRERGREALDFFCKMHLCGVHMDEFTFSSILSGIARLSATTWGSLIHGCLLKHGLDGYVVVGSALIDMYFKCGQIEEAEKSFHSLPDKNLVTWNAMITGYAHNGNFRMVIHLFEKLKSMRNLQPDEITFLNVFSACWHIRIPLKIANQFFESMINEYMIEPTPEHCSLMIRLLGQEGHLNKAEAMIKELGYSSCGMVWKALLSACVTCGNLEVAEVAAAKVIELESDNEFVYVMMSNIYASKGKWDNACGVREMMKERMVVKEAGCSWIEVEDVIPTSLMI